MQARYYDPMGRMLSVDPVGPTPGNIYSFNRYGYASNNPIMNIDPDGRQSVGEMINSGAEGCGPVSCAGWAIADAGWQVLGAEGISQIADKGWSNTSGADRASAGLEIAAVLPPVRILGEVAPIAKEITLSFKGQGEAAVHAADAIKAGKPDVLTIARDGASANRKAATGGIQKVPGKQLDEYPPAMFKEGGSGASVRAINSSENMSAGACIGNACRGLANGDKVRIKVEE